MKKANEMTVAERLKAPTPKFWRKVGKIGGLLTTIGTFASSIPKFKPIAKILQVVGVTLAGASELTVDEEEVNQDS